MTTSRELDQVIEDRIGEMLPQVIDLVNDDPQMRSLVSKLKPGDVSRHYVYALIRPSEEYARARLAWFRESDAQVYRTTSNFIYGLSALLAVAEALYFILLLARAARLAKLKWLEFGLVHTLPALFGLALAGLVFVFCVIGAGAFIGDRHIIAEQELKSAQEALEPKLRETIRSVVTERANAALGSLQIQQVSEIPEDLADRQEDAKSDDIPIVIGRTDTTRLVEMATSESIDRAALEEIESFVRDNTTSAVGISGPRGAGKTTLIKRVCSTDAENRLGVYIASPVGYEAKDFVRVIYGEVARAFVLRFRNPLRIRQNTTAPLLVALLCLYLGGGLLVIRNTVGTRWLNGWNVFAGLLTLSSFVFLYQSYSRRRYALALRRASTDNASFFRSQIESLSWIESTSDTTSLEMAPMFAKLSKAMERSRQEREKTHPELVIAFKNFVAEANSRTKLTIVVGLDELDKITNGDEAVRLVNGIKDLMHLDGVHFVVSVSEDALARFALRGIPFRDEFDSTFDTVVLVSYLSLQDSQVLANQRVLAFPDQATFFCYAISGGLPRDLIRYIRMCAVIPQHHGATVPAGTVCCTVAGKTAISVIRAFESLMRRKTESLDQGERDALANLRQHTAFLEAALAASDALPELSLTPAELGRLIDTARTTLEALPEVEATACSVVLAILTESAYLFGVNMTVQSFANNATRATLADAATTLANARQLVASDVDSASRLVTAVRTNRTALLSGSTSPTVGAGDSM